MKFSLSSAESGDWFSLRSNSALQDATLTALSFKEVRKAIILLIVVGASLGKDGLMIGKVLDPAQVEQQGTRVLNDPILSPSLVSKDGRSTLVAVELDEFD